MAGEPYPKMYLYRRIVQAKLFIDKFYFDPIDLDNIADEAFFSKFHFIRLFKKMYGKTPHQYLVYTRIENAKLLLQSEKAISNVCFSVGFESISSFAGLFKKIVGLAPSVYQVQQHTIKAGISKTPLKYIPNCFAENNGWAKNSNFGEVES